MAAKKKQHPSDAFAALPPEDVRRRKRIGILSLIVIAVVFGLIAYFVGFPLVKMLRENPDSFRDYVNSHGALGPFLMMGIMALQVVVAIIPGEPFEWGSGFVFGWFFGALWCLIGSAIASALLYLAVRKWGIKLVEAFFPREKILKYSFLQDEKRLNLLTFILFLIPGTPKDLLTYLMGLTPMRFTPYILLSSLARIPSLVSSSIAGNYSFQGNWTATVITYVLNLLISVPFIVWYRRLSKETKEKSRRQTDARKP